MMARKFGFFEKILLVVGVFIVFLGYFMIQKMVAVSGGLLTWDGVNAVFLWVLVILVLILIAANENVKEELKAAHQETVKELKLMKHSLRVKKK
jgi:hypothetical protein